MAAGVERDGGLQSQLRADVVRGDGGGGGAKGVVEVGDVGLVVFGVVEGHDLLGNLGFECLQL